MTEPGILHDPVLISGDLSKIVSSKTVIRHHELLAKRTTLRVGGPADLYIEPASEADLTAALKFFQERQVPVFVLGRGSNLLVKDGGFRGAVICLAQPAFSAIQVLGQELRCGAGAKLKAVSIEARRGGIGGLEFLEGIPGSIGGALRMNAGAMGGSIFDIVVSVRLMSFDGSVQEVAPSAMSVNYRSCPTLKTKIALQAVLRGQTRAREEIEQRMGEFSKRRWESQPAASSAGCIFKNPPTIGAGKLVDELGLKGTKVGGAMVSMEHGNFLINDGTATARDVMELIEVVRARARAERGIELETEVEIIGE
jgi:UDP-N-acetylenolpyruvoylglucosamine reductase